MQKLTIIMGITVSGVTLWMFAIGESFKRIMMFLYLLCFMGGLGFNAWNMYMVISVRCKLICLYFCTQYTYLHYQEAVSEQIAESRKYMHIPDVCDPKKLSWWNYLFSSN